MLQQNNSIILWCFFYEYTTDILSLCAISLIEFQGRTPDETVMNYTPDISEYALFSWFQWLWFYDQSLKIKQVCRWLVPAHGVGQAFSLKC